MYFECFVYFKNKINTLFSHTDIGQKVTVLCRKINMKRFSNSAKYVTVKVRKLVQVFTADDPPGVAVGVMPLDVVAPLAKRNM